MRFSRLGSSRKKRGFLDWNNFLSLLLSLCSPPRCYPAQPARFPRFSFNFLCVSVLLQSRKFSVLISIEGDPLSGAVSSLSFLATNYGAQSSKQRLCPLFFPFGPPSIAIDPTTMTEAVDAIHRIPNLSLFFGTNMIHSSFPFSNFVSYMETE